MLVNGSIHHCDFSRDNNKLKNLLLLAPAKNTQKSLNKPVISINIITDEEKIYGSIKTITIELKICGNSITQICKRRQKTATSEKDGHKYRFEYV